MNCLKTCGIFGTIVLLFCSAHSFSQTAKLFYHTPASEARYINPEQTIILKTENGFDQRSINNKLFSIQGSVSGALGFSIRHNKERNMLTLIPDVLFNYGEKVSVKINPGLKDELGGSFVETEFCFYIKEKETLSLLKKYLQSETNDFYIPLANQETKQDERAPLAVNNLPLDFPIPQITFGDNFESDDKLLFMDLRSRQHPIYNLYLSILDRYGTPVYFQKTDFPCLNFHVLDNGYLAYSDANANNPAAKKYMILDSSYRVIDSVMMGNGYVVDGHDMLLLENGNYLMMAYDPQIVNMSEVVPGGQPAATVIGLVIQEVDLNRQVYFEWRSWDHFEITDATHDIDLTSDEIDYVHGNAFEIDTDGNILLSSRNMDEITKIDFNTGNILWRFGLNCENNMFEIHYDFKGFSHQHDIRKRANGNYTIFDNGNNHTPQLSQALEYQIDEQNLDAYLVWNYQRTDVYAFATGSFRTLDDGKKLIGWGVHYPLNVTELNPDNSVSFDLSLPDLVTSYRAIKHEWKTNLFSSRENLSFGNFAGYSSPKENYLYIHNHSEDTIQITSIHNHKDAYEVLTSLPLEILPFNTQMMKFKFNPSEAGDYNDLLTLNFDNESMSKRIAIQVELAGIWDEDVPSVFTNPVHGSTNVAPDSPIIITFDRAVIKRFGGDIVDSNIPNLVNLRLENYDGESVGFTGTINDEKTEITIYPDNSLVELQQYYIELKGGMIKESLGEAVIVNAEISYFRTGLQTDIPSVYRQQIEVYPNPFSNYTTFTYELQQPSVVQITIFNHLGKQVDYILQNQPQGKQQIHWDASAQPSGMYYFHLQAGGQVASGKMILVE